MAKQATLHTALPIVAAAYGRRFGVDVHISGDIARTNGKSIILPCIPQSYPHQDALWGYLAHEAAHVRFTDFSVDFGVGVVKHLFNIVEDARIERQMICVYPGTALTLNEVARYMAQAGHYQIPTETSPAPLVLEAFCLYYLQCKVVGQDAISDILATTRAVFERVFPKGVQVRLHSLLRKVPGLKSSQDARNLVDDIMKMLKEEEQKPTDNEKPTDNADKKPSPGSNGSNETKGKTPLQEVLAAGSEDKDHIKDAHASFRNELTSEASDNGDPHYRTIREAQDVLDDADSGRQIRAEVDKTTSRIRSQLAGLVQASQQRGSRRVRSGRRIDPAQLHKLQSGNARLFRRDAPRQRPNTAVHLIVDMSSSMKNLTAAGKPMFRVAREAAMALGLALEALPGVNPGVTFFGAKKTNPVFSAIRHGQSVKNNTGRFAMAPTGGTPMAEAVWYGAFELVQTKEERKMLIVVTDGESRDVAAIRKVVSLCEASNVEVIGIGIQTSSVSTLFDKHIVIKDAGDLSNTLFKLMEQSLT